MKEHKFKTFPKTEDELWDECIRMHSDIFKDGRFNLTKDEWLKREGYSPDIFKDCFFCQYQQNNPVKDNGSGLCTGCPGNLVDPRFGCMNTAYNYSHYDGKFVDKLKELNKIRKAKL
jgi:hypothetical protein